MSKQYYIYLLTNPRNTVLYTGVTSNIEKRLWEHKNNVTDGFTAKYNCSKLVYFEVYDSAEQAITREKAIKNLVRRKKDLLISKVNPNWVDLSARVLSPSAPE